MSKIMSTFTNPIQKKSMTHEKEKKNLNQNRKKLININVKCEYEYVLYILYIEKKIHMLRSTGTKITCHYAVSISNNLTRIIYCIRYDFIIPTQHLNNF